LYTYTRKYDLENRNVRIMKFFEVVGAVTRKPKELTGGPKLGPAAGDRYRPRFPEKGEHCVAGKRMLECPGADSVRAHIGRVQLASCLVAWHTQEIATRLGSESFIF
jgi:hypothetical protein